MIVGLAWCAACEVDPTSQLAATAGNSLFGLNVPADGAASDIASDLGAQWARVEVIDGIDFTATLDVYHARGVAVLALVDYGTLAGYPGFGGGPCGDWWSWRTAWLARIESLARTLGDRVDAWEIWNEPDQPMLACGQDGYNPGMPAGEYGPLLRDAYVTLRDAGATGPIITGGLDSGQVSYIVDGAAAAGGLFADGVAIHPYGVVPDPSWCPDPGEDLVCEFGTLGGKLDEYAAATGLPVWVTELGVKTHDTQHEADYVAGAYATLAAHAGSVGPAFYFCATDAMVPPFGLTFADGTPKPAAYATYRALATSDSPPPPPPGSTHTPMLHGTVETAGAGIAGVRVSAWGQRAGDFHVAFTDVLGIYQLTDLDPDSLYNVVVNAQFDGSGFVVVDGAHGFEVRDNVELASGPDGWHGEDFGLPF